MKPAGVPSFVGFMVRLILSPGLNASWVQPLRARMLMVEHSMVNSVAGPDGPGAMTISQAWGFFHWNSFTVPLIGTILVWSNMAAEWCAIAACGATAANIAVRAARAVLRIVFMGRGPLAGGMSCAGCSDSFQLARSCAGL